MSQMEPLLPSDFDGDDAETANMESLERGVRSPGLVVRQGVNSNPYAAVPKPPMSEARKKFQRGVRKAMIAKEMSVKKNLLHRRRNSMMIASEATQPKGHRVHHSFTDVVFLSPLFDDGSTENADSEIDGDDCDDNDNTTEPSNGETHHHPGTLYGTSPRTTRNHRRTTNKKTSMCRLLITRRFWSDLLYTLLHSTLLWIALPCAIAAVVLYYAFANPLIDFLPGSVTVAWWFNFIARQMVTFEAARLLQYVLVDSLLLKSRWDRSQLVSFVGYHIQGWPFVLIFWAIIDLFVLHGNNKFQVHWLYWTRWKIYSHEANSGAYILTSGLYRRTLLSMIFVGVATTIKRCFLELQFGGKLHTTFKPKLEQILREMVLVTEVAALGEEADFLQDLEDVDTASFRSKTSKEMGLASQAVDWSSKSRMLPNVRLALNEAGEAEDSDDDEALAGNDLSFAATMTGSQSISGIECLLDRWEEPADQDKKSSIIGVNDAVTFRRVLTHLKKKSPFGEAFGPNWDRRVTIQSSQMLYNRLLKLSENASRTLPFDTLSVIAYGIDGMIDKDKFRALRKVFCPDAKGELPLLAFVGSIDAVYKRLRYFQASVANASKLDKVLEDTLNVAFYFVLSLVILVFMNFNPWPVLVSITSLLVSVSFALGSSLSKWVEGILLIAVRRPYDLGDRIIITSAESLESPGSPASWYVEDINLFSTTLRYARTNEVSSLNNSSIAASRIINCNRSAHAIVFLTKVTHISILKGNSLKQFKSTLEDYVLGNPRIWDSLAFLRIEDIDTNFEQVKFSMAFRHRNSWQDAGRILLNRADLLRFVCDTLKDLDAAYDTPPARRLLYFGGELEEGTVKDYKINLLSAANIRKKASEQAGNLSDDLQMPLEGE